MAFNEDFFLIFPYFLNPYEKKNKNMHNLGANVLYRECKMGWAEMWGWNVTYEY